MIRHIGAIHDADFVGGCKMPSDQAISAQDRNRAFDAEYGSARLLDGYRRYFAKHGVVA